MSFYKEFHYNVVPPLFIIFFTSSVQFMALHWSGQPLTYENILKGQIGNTFSWCAVFVLILWALIWLWLPGRTSNGPISNEGEIAEYKDNGVSYFFGSIGAFLILEHFYGDLSQRIYHNMSPILGTLNVIALALCIYLYATAKSKADDHLPKIYLFYRGRDLYPTLLGVQVKQLTNCRIGLILWEILPLAFFIASSKENSFNFPSFITLLIQSVYLYKFFLWESGYFHTLDIILDRAGYYICWGCLVWVPCFYTSASYYFVKYPPTISNFNSILCGLVGLGAIYIQYQVDMQKMTFRSLKDNCLIWGRKPTFIVTKKLDENGRKTSRDILTSGFWGIARHLNYTLEIIIAVSYSLPGYQIGIGPFLYPIFLTYLLLHRIYRDEKKCHSQYGKYWEQYCNQVPYRLIPYVF